MMMRRKYYWMNVDADIGVFDNKKNRRYGDWTVSRLNQKMIKEMNMNMFFPKNYLYRNTHRNICNVTTIANIHRMLIWASKANKGREVVGNGEKGAGGGVVGCGWFDRKRDKRGETTYTTSSFYYVNIRCSLYDATLKSRPKNRSTSSGGWVSELFCWCRFPIFRVSLLMCLLLLLLLLVSCFEFRKPSVFTLNWIASSHFKNKLYHHHQPIIVFTQFKKQAKVQITRTASRK